MNVEKLVNIIGADFYTGVPDTRLAPLCSYLMHTYGTDPVHHVIGANEGCCAALAAGYHLATGNTPVVYLRNSGEGSLIDPAASLLDETVCGIPMIFIIGWQGEPGLPDEPQNLRQGMITQWLLEDMGIPSFVIDPDTTEEQVTSALLEFQTAMSMGHDVAFLVKRGGLTWDAPSHHGGTGPLLRRDILKQVLAVSGSEPIVAATGLTSRDLYELREELGQGHEQDFLMAGSMGHSSSLALGVALQKPDTRVWCIDGDGGLLMQLGTLAVIASAAPDNLIHLVLNNGVRESIGGMPTPTQRLDITAAARACGYPHAVCVEDTAGLDAALAEAHSRRELTLIEVRCGVDSRVRGELPSGFPDIRPSDNKDDFMNFLAFL